MLDALEGFHGGAKNGGLVINNLRLADDIDLITDNAKDLEDLTERLDKTSRSYGMEISAEKSKTMVTMVTNDKNTQTISTKVNGEQLKQVHSFKYLGSTIPEDFSSETQINNRIVLNGNQCLGTTSKNMGCKEYFHGKQD
uniref:Uncharacterized protein LOC102804223 n=1 Tax=Saccoglossus kowalevskii TaxID=10224 RepID=A0ABM0MT29_SACKO|nr:PREDICTED: uncharacterized protein LOC102804223 [Saccoglossus kowalevskii]